MMNNKIIVKLATHDPKCKYQCHKTPGAVFSLEDLAPRGICHHAYFAAYPYCLSLMYQARFEFMPDADTVSFQCPSPVRPVVMLAQRVRVDEKRIKVIVKITERIERPERADPGFCASCPVEPGQEFEWNHMGQRPEICPAGFLHLFPYLTTLLHGGKPPWSTGEKSFLVHCPDEKINISYEIIVTD
jgi:uncharacterized repeat protein (TIGR04076 family)